MRVVGHVQWAEKDKSGIDIAGVRPLYEMTPKGDWTPIDAETEFPTRGLIFWWHAKGAQKDSFVIFRPEPNVGNKDEFKVADAKLLMEVIDLRHLGREPAVRHLLSKGVKLSGSQSILRVLILCQQELLIGPVELTRSSDGVAQLAKGNLHRIGAYDGSQVRTIDVDGVQRTVRVDDSPPVGFVDWDTDAAVIRRALETAVQLNKIEGVNIGQTKKELEKAARAISEINGPDAYLDNYRLEKSLSYIKHADVVERNSESLIEALRQHPTIARSIETMISQLAAKAEADARLTIEKQLVSEHNRLEELKEEIEEARAALEAMSVESVAKKEQLSALQSSIDQKTRHAEEVLDEKILSSMERPIELLAEVSVLKPFLLSSDTKKDKRADQIQQVKPKWGQAPIISVNDRAALRKHLLQSASALGVDIGALLQIHTSLVAALVPVVLGPTSTAVIKAYCGSICGGRMHMLPVSPRDLSPGDLEKKEVIGPLQLAGDLMISSDGYSVLFLEGLNRAPIESIFLPTLQLRDAGLSVLSERQNLKFMASLVSGVTTVPVPPDLWYYSSLISPQLQTNSYPKKPEILTQHSLQLTSDMLVPADVSPDIVDSMLEKWPDCLELKPTLTKLARAAARLHDDPSRISRELLNCVLLPWIATALSIEEQNSAVEAAGDPDGSLSKALIVLRRRLA